MRDHRHIFLRQPRWSLPSSVGLPRSVPQPQRYRHSPASAELGRTLFFDKRVSQSGSIACASCHEPQFGFSDGRRISIGIHARSTRRNTISLLNVAFRPVLRWDAYATSLEQFVEYPLSTDDEMASHRLDQVVKRIRHSAAYRARFARAFGPRKISLDTIAQALASYLRTLVSGDSPFDRATTGGERRAMSDSAWRGYALFNGRARCSGCHSYSPESPFFTDLKPHNTGLGWNAASSRYSDTGAGATSASVDTGKFRTPTLRDVGRTAPYMHDGSIATLRGVVDYFARGGGDGPNRDPELRPLHLSEQDKRDLSAFLRALTGTTRFDSEGRRIDHKLAADR
jgi:cytochrome c peroxidase